MKNRQRLAVVLSLCALALMSATPGRACTSLLVTGGASADGSVMITYTCDGEFHPHLEYMPPADYEPGDSLEITDWHGNQFGWIEQVPHTYAVVGMMNEHQLTIGETTFDGREELRNRDATLNYWHLINLALARARTAREAITVMTDLVAAYGYSSTGESFSLADPREAWILEMIGPGPGGTGAEWVAVRVPDGYISAHANQARIGEFPLDDPDNCLYSDNVISFAVERGYYDPASGEPFRFCDAYCPAIPRNLRSCEARVWSLFRRAAPSMNLPPDYHRGVPDAEPYPLWIKPDRKLSLADVFSLMRDHYEGTPFDMTTGIDAGPYGCPYRWRPLSWTVGSVEYRWERPISTQQTGYSFVSQSRSWLEDPVGGVFWYGVDDTYMTCYVPLYCCIDAVPESFTVGSLTSFSWESAWWVFNFVANIANLKYSYMAPEVLAVQNELEGTFLALQPAVEKTALQLVETDRDLARRYLTDYSVSHAEMVVKQWRALGEHLLTTYNDGYVKDEEGDPEEKGYPETWLRRVLKSRPDQYRVPVQRTVQADEAASD
ncbi:MAG TPA: C69 family dipeptidase [Acidobacteriota bacterium]|nr:C69 family dipeptidase [Acidobacteriota bacterium]